MVETPVSLGYRMPAEWEKHEATWTSWPKDPDTFPPSLLPKVEVTFGKMVDALSDGEEVRILVEDENMQKRVANMLGKDGTVVFHRIRTIDVWVRDYGPTYVIGKNQALVKWAFNAWGNKYPDLIPDDDSGEILAASTRLKVFRPGIVLEGGAVDVNGSGTLMTTEQCLLNPNRNPGLGKKQLHKIMADYLGVENVIWLGSGIEGDDTDGHVDDIARFVGPRTVVVGCEPDPGDPNHRALDVDRRKLEESTDEKGRPIKVVELPMPERLGSTEGRLPASHLNFYIGNSAVLVPTFGGKSDREALKAMEDLFPGKDVVGIDCRALVYGLGTIHCVTQQVPSVK
jgi:agmatine deiminase